jgi:hypothetical protein
MAALGALVGWAWSRTHAQPSWSVEPWRSKREWAVWAVVLPASLSGIYVLVSVAVGAIAVLFGLVAHWKPVQPTAEETALHERGARVKSWITVAFILALAALTALSGDFGATGFFLFLAAMMGGAFKLDDWLTARRERRKVVASEAKPGAGPLLPPDPVRR